MHSQLPFRNLHPCAAAIQPLPPSVHAARPAHHFIAFITSITQVSNVNRTAFSIRAQPSAKDFPHQLQQLSDWKSAFGTCCVPPSATDASKLSKWVRWARKAAKQGLLQDEQQQQLESLDFVWKPNVVGIMDNHKPYLEQFDPSATLQLSIVPAGKPLSNWRSLYASASCTVPRRVCSSAYQLVAAAVQKSCNPLTPASM